MSEFDQKIAELAMLAETASELSVTEQSVERAVIRREDTMAYGRDLEGAFLILEGLTQSRIGNIASTVLAAGELLVQGDDPLQAQGVAMLIAQALSKQRSKNGFNRLENRLWSRLRESDRDAEYYQAVGRQYEQAPHEHWVYHVMSDYSCVEVMPVGDSVELRAHGSWRNFVEHRWTTEYQERVPVRVYWQPQPSDLVIKLPGVSGLQWRQLLRVIEQQG